MRQLSILICVITILFSSLSTAKPLAKKEKVDKVSDYFMGQLTQGEYESAYSLMSAYIGVNSSQFEERGKKISHDMKMLESRQGKPLSFDLLKKESVGEHFYKITYLLKYPSAALIWELNYYQPEQGWNLVDISFNTNINALFE